MCSLLNPGPLRAKKKKGSGNDEKESYSNVYAGKSTHLFKRETMKNIIKVSEKRIDAFKEKMEETGLKVKAKYGKEVKVLGQKNRAMKKRLEGYNDEGQSKWKAFKTNFKHDMDGIGKTVKQLFKHK